MAQAAIATEPKLTPSESRLSGVDSIRFWLALWVYFSHFGLLPFADWIGKSSAPRLFFTGFANNLFNGAGAVIGFFVISGLCIHYPNRRAGSVPVLQFYVRRYIRISIPLVAALACGYWIGSDLIGFYNAILWSLIAELVYYTIYPFLLPLWRGIGWRAMLATSYAIAAIIVLRSPKALNFHEFGPGLTWVVGLPSWLLGCCLAENCGTQASVSFVRIWGWRLLAWILASAASLLRFHAGIGYPLTLTILGPVLYEWLRRELARYRSAPAVPIFEFAGQFSYSIYLMHGLAVALLGMTSPLLVGDALWAYPVRLLSVIAVSYGFFVLIERPSHRLSRWTARKLRD